MWAIFSVASSKRRSKYCSRPRPALYDHSVQVLWWSLAAGHCVMCQIIASCFLEHASSGHPKSPHSHQISVQAQRRGDVVEGNTRIMDLQLDQNLRSVSSSLMNLCRQFWRHKGLQPSTTHLTLWHCTRIICRPEHSELTALRCCCRIYKQTIRSIRKKEMRL